MEIPSLQFWIAFVAIGQVLSDFLHWYDLKKISYRMKNIEDQLMMATMNKNELINLIEEKQQEYWEGEQ